jgi:hypothetical protein
MSAGQRKYAMAEMNPSPMPQHETPKLQPGERLRNRSERKAPTNIPRAEGKPKPSPEMRPASAKEKPWVRTRKDAFHMATEYPPSVLRPAARASQRKSRFEKIAFVDRVLF